MLRVMESTVDETCTAEKNFRLLQPHASLSGIPLHAPTEHELEEALHRSFSLGRLCRVSALRFRDVWRARKDVTFRGILRRMDLLVPEGSLVTLASRLSMKRLPSDRVRTDLINPVLTVAQETARRVFFLVGVERSHSTGGGGHPSATQASSSLELTLRGPTFVMQRAVDAWRIASTPAGLTWSSRCHRQIGARSSHSAMAADSRRACTSI